MSFATAVPRISAVVLATSVGLLVLSQPVSSAAQTARLTFEQIFGTPAASLNVAFGNVDAQCISTPSAGVTCFADPAGAYATWYGNIQFRARVTGLGGGGSVRLVGQRQAGGSMPAGRLLDGTSGVPATAYPVAPAAALTLATAISVGNTLITRVIGVRALPSDAAGAWSTQVVYSLIIE